MAENWQKACGVTCLGCGVLLLIGAAVASFLVPNVVGSVKDVYDRQTWFAQWQGPPEDAPPEELLPLKVENLTRGEITVGTGPEVLDLADIPFTGAQYEGSGQTVGVWAGRYDEQGRDRTFGRAEQAPENTGGGMNSKVDIGNILNMRWDKPKKGADLYWQDNWLYVFYSDDAEALDGFADALLRQVETGSN